MSHASNRTRSRPNLALGLLASLAAACATPQSSEPPVPAQHPSATVAQEPQLVPAAESQLYAAEEALRDVLASELQYLGAGRWPGVERSRACAFRNDRVLVVNVYCTRIESPAFRIEVYSPERGRIRLYAEANGPISARRRGEYFTFMAESGPPPGRNVMIRPMVLSMSYEELSSYEQVRYDSRLPGCFGGEQLHKPVSGCFGSPPPPDSEWAARNRAFLQQPSDDWYRVIQRMRELANQYGTAASDVASERGRR